MPAVGGGVCCSSSVRCATGWCPAAVRRARAAACSSRADAGPVVSPPVIACLSVCLFSEGSGWVGISPTWFGWCNIWDVCCDWQLLCVTPSGVPTTPTARDKTRLPCGKQRSGAPSVSIASLTLSVSTQQVCLSRQQGVTAGASHRACSWARSQATWALQHILRGLPATLCACACPESVRTQPQRARHASASADPKLRAASESVATLRGCVLSV